VQRYESIRPPKLARRLLSTFLRSDFEEDVLGDLDERFQLNVQRSSLFHARLKYWHEVANYIRPFAIKKLRPSYPNPTGMFQSYFKVGFRNLLKNKLFSAINVSGMAISISSILLIALFINDELSFDRHVEDVDLKYRVYNEHFMDDGSKRKGAMVPPAIGPALEAEYPEVESYTRFLNFNYPTLLKVGDKKLSESGGGFADSTAIEMFDLKMLEGDPTTALSEPNSIVLNATLKKKYFGDKPALGQEIGVNNANYKVGGVFEDMSTHSHLQIKYMISMENYAQGAAKYMQSWTWNQFHTYIKLKKGSDAAALETKLKDLAERNAWPKTKPSGAYYIPHLIAYDQIHLHASDQLWDIAVRGNAQTVYILIAAALFILVIAILNFVNLSTARAVNRTKEVGVRKVVGAFRRQIINQFLSESFIVVLLALIIGSLAAVLLLPGLSSFTEKNISPWVLLDPKVVVTLILFTFITAIAAGAYPAFYISSYKPAQILGNKKSGRSGKTLLRKGLVVLQFVLSFFLIIASLTISNQYSFMRTTDMGFDKDNLIVLQLRGDMSKNMETTKNTFSDHPNIVSASLGYGLPGEAFAGDNLIDQRTGKAWNVNLLTIDHDYAKTLGLEIIAGRDFSKDFPSDEHEAYIVSEAAVKLLGYTDPKDALGHDVAWNRWDAQDSLKRGKVIGVVKDVQLNSMREAIAPVVLQIFPDAYSTLTLRVKPNDLPMTVAHLEKTWKTYNSEWPFEYRFLDENFDKMYKSEEKLTTLFTFFTGLTIFVACLGLFGLVVYSTTQRYKEISIRKVLGAGEGSLVLGLTKSYAALILIAFIIAVPLSYYAASTWLEKFAFRIELTPMLFVKAALFIAGISVLTVGIQSFKAARANPVDALKEQ
jgi:putative ABC transport system permease protein